MTSSLQSVAAQPMAVEADGICRRYGNRWALIDVGFQVPRGSALMVAGRNGSGKSTLFRVLSTAIRPDRGGARIEGLDLLANRQEVRERIALLSHHSNMYESLTALQNLQVSARFLPNRFARESLMELLSHVGLADRADDGVLTFSAGMRKRLVIARTLLQVGAFDGLDGEIRSSVVFLDEPYGQLDPEGFRFVDKLFESLRRRGVTVLLATHLLERGADFCDHGIVLTRGRVTWRGPAGELPTRGGLGPDSDGVA